MIEKSSSAAIKCPIPLHEFDKSDGIKGPAHALPGACFTSSEFYDFEFKAVWEKEWFCIGRATDIPNSGDYFTITVGKEPLFAIRDGAGNVNVLTNVCQHRAMLLLDGHGNTKRIRCPLHSWVYSLDGNLLSAPALNDVDDFDKGAVCLPRIRSEIWEGFIFITFDESLAPVGERLAHLSGQLANFRMSELSAATPLEMIPYDWDWKIYGDECYHCTHLHSGTWCNFYPTPEDCIDEDTHLSDPERGIIAYQLKSEVLDPAPTRTGKILHPLLPDLTKLERSGLQYVTVMPNLLIVTQSDKVKYFLWLPRGPEQSYFGVSWLFPKSTLEGPNFAETAAMEKNDLGPVMEEDLYAWSRSQAGLRSRFAPRGRLSPKEKVIAQFYGWLIDRYRAAS
ncbi:aromatic ring-hydroxylating dioxygenase subunit alpha [Hyphomicrobium sp. 99]|uniref:aromatic ring-hydroxylating oxygenase subunit alpha n=1 Tax=Hyphomicrobium sp. 99 TaxID=1163419 RepID=UPI0005F84096|nr:aromatic ring-hydroxylating dioxygenase subunit alpha [Hyphomicrobium sp. 99]